MDDSPRSILRRLVNGYQVSQAIHVAATLGVADRLRATARARATSSPRRRRAHPARCTACCARSPAVGVLHEEDGRRFALTPIGECLRSDAAGPVGGWAAFIGRPYYWQAWGALLHSVRTGENAFAPRARRRPVDLPGRAIPRRRAIFDRGDDRPRAPLARARRSPPTTSRASARSSTSAAATARCSWRSLRAHPAMRGVLFDLPHAVAAAERATRRGRGRASAADGRGQLLRGGAGRRRRLRPARRPARLGRRRGRSRSCERAARACAAGGGAARHRARRSARPTRRRTTKFSDLNMLVDPGRTRAHDRRVRRAARRRRLPPRREPARRLRPVRHGRHAGLSGPRAARTHAQVCTKGAGLAVKVDGCRRLCESAQSSGTGNSEVPAIAQGVSCQTGQGPARSDARASSARDSCCSRCSPSPSSAPTAHEPRASSPSRRRARRSAPTSSRSARSCRSRRPSSGRTPSTTAR